MALSVALLTVAGAQLWTMAKSWVEMAAGDIPSDEYLVADLRWDFTPAGEAGVELRPDDIRRRTRTWRALEQRLSQEPAVRGVTFSSGGLARPFALEGVSTADRETTPWSTCRPSNPTFSRPTAGRSWRAVPSGRATPEDPTPA